MEWAFRTYMVIQILLTFYNQNDQITEYSYFLLTTIKTCITGLNNLPYLLQHPLTYL